jgi:cystathionine beta-lyase
MPYDFDSKPNRKDTLSVKWDGRAIESIAGTTDAEPFWVADMDFTVPPEVIEQVEKTAREGVYGYPNLIGQTELFGRWAAKRHGWKVRPDDVVVCSGMLASIAMLTELLTDAGDGVIVPFPAYRPFMHIVDNLERKLVRWPLAYDEQSRQFSLDFDRFGALCSQARLLIFCSPHNPSGREFTEAELERVCTIARDHGVTIVCDEIHADLTFGTHHPLLVAAEKTGCKAVTCMAPSKTFNIAGEHYSLAIIPDEQIRNALRHRMTQLCMTESSLFSATAANSAYRYGYDWLMQLVPYLQQNLELIETYCRERIVKLHPVRPMASFVGLIDCNEILSLAEMDEKANPDLYDRSKSPSGGLLSRFFGIRAKVAVNDGTWFGGEEYRRFVRFNYGTQRASVEGALQRMEGAVRFLEQTYGA